MGANSKIEWCDHTFNPWLGCAKVSAGCEHRYAERFASLFPMYRGCWGVDGRRVRTSDANWRLPLKWDCEAARDGVRRRVFCGSLCDVFDDNQDINPMWRINLAQLIANTSHLDWLLLTKRPQNHRLMQAAFEQVNGARWIIKRYNDETNNKFWLDRVWLGTSVENQAEADARIPALLRIPAAKHFLSVEPMLGPLDIGQKMVNVPAAKWLPSGEETPGGPYPWESRWVYLTETVRCDWLFDENDLKMIATPGVYRAHSNKYGALSVMTEGGLLGIKPDEFRVLPALDWVICGGESGPNARPMHPDWARDLRDQCVAAGVPFFFKQWGAYEPCSGVEDENHAGFWHDPTKKLIWVNRDTYKSSKLHLKPCPLEYPMQRVGKKAAGRVLDGRTWDQYPEENHDQQNNHVYRRNDQGIAIAGRVQDAYTEVN